ncbi:hypothetical protein C8R43DRAFT_1119310 [Mycena crocata]|nr:hypothetical protein C8R43DRAFT_1119310 [Mycena crocata]
MGELFGSMSRCSSQTNNLLLYNYNIANPTLFLPQVSSGHSDIPNLVPPHTHAIQHCSPMFSAFFSKSSNIKAAHAGDNTNPNHISPASTQTGTPSHDADAELAETVHGICLQRDRNNRELQSWNDLLMTRVDGVQEEEASIEATVNGLEEEERQWMIRLDAIDDEISGKHTDLHSRLGEEEYASWMESQVSSRKIRATLKGTKHSKGKAPIRSARVPMLDVVNSGGETDLRSPEVNDTT